VALDKNFESLAGALNALPIYVPSIPTPISLRDAP
jgi:hypothetical protein